MKITTIRPAMFLWIYGGIFLLFSILFIVFEVNINIMYGVQVKNIQKSI